MVARSTDRPRTFVGTVGDVQSQLEDVVRAAGHGTPELRNAADHTLLLDPASPVPFIRPTQEGVAVNSGLKFTATGVEITDATGEAPRDATVRNVTARDVDADSLAAGGRTVVAGLGGLNAGPLSVATKMQAGVGGITSSGPVAAGGNVTSANMAASNYVDDGLGNVRNGAVWSRAGLKTAVAPFREQLAERSCTDVVRSLDLISYRYNRQARDALGAPDEVQSGFMLEDLEAAAPALVRYAGPDNRPRDDDYVGPQPLPEAIAAQAPPPQDAYSRHDMQTVMLGMLQEKDDEIIQLSDAVRELARRLDALTE